MNLKSEVENVVARAKIAFSSTESSAVKVIAALRVHPALTATLVGVGFVLGAVSGRLL